MPARAAAAAASRRSPGRRPSRAAAGVSPVALRSLSLTDELVRRAEAGAPEVVRALADAGRSLGIALASTFNLFDVQAVVLGGCFGPLAPWLAGEVRRTLEERSLAARSGSFVVLPSAFGDGAAVRGAAALSLHRLLDAPWAAPNGRFGEVLVARRRAHGAGRRWRSGAARVSDVDRLISRAGPSSVPAGGLTMKEGKE